MNRFRKSIALGHLLPVAMYVAAALPSAALAGSVALATSPLASSTVTTVKPNLLFIIDNSGSMEWDHMPDDSSDGGSSVSFQYGFYGLRSNQCNQVYYDPTLTYDPPVYADGTTYPNATFTGAWTNGFNTGAGTVNLDTGFRASLSLDSDDSTARSAYYYAYSGVQDTAEEKNYHSTTSTFYKECNESDGSSTSYPPVVGSGDATVFTKRRLASTMTTTIRLNCSSCSSTQVSSIKVNGVELMSGNTASSTGVDTIGNDLAGKITLNGFSATYSSSSDVLTITGPATAANYTPVITKSGSMTLTPDIFPETDSAKLTNFANWYSYYRTRMLMMKTAAGRAFMKLDNNYRVGLMKISASSTPVLGVGDFESTQRNSWYTSLYGMTASGSTPLRTALSNAGRYFAGELSTTDPIQYSCQQNFTILSTDGYWNTGDGFKLDGSTAVGNQDGTASPDTPYWDGAQSGTTVTITYTRNSYTCVTSGCSWGKAKKKTQPQIGSCSVTVAGTPTGSETCNPSNWSNYGSSTTATTCLSGCTSSYSTKTEVDRVTSPGSIGGSSDNLADIAMYYYETDLRTSALGNCSGVISGEDVCTNNVFTSSSDNKSTQHMTTFTLGMGASGKMNYSPTYSSDPCSDSSGNPLKGDYCAATKHLTADSSQTPPVCSWQSNGTTCTWPIPGMSGSDGLITNIDDLWHAAVNGRGVYFAATNPTSLAYGLSNALSGLKQRRGAAAAAATSTLNPVPGNNSAFIASYTTISWKGNLEARGINTDTGAISRGADWCLENVAAETCSSGNEVTETDGDVTVRYCVQPNASESCANLGGVVSGTDCKVPMATACTGTMQTKVSDTSDTRTIYTSSGTALTPFDTTYAAAHPSYFSSMASSLSQWSSLNSSQQTNAASDTNMINFLRGQYGYEMRISNDTDKQVYRYREAVMADALESEPAFLAGPVFDYPYAGYASFKASNASRAPTVYMGANDGMMHSFDADTGNERWAYVPSMVIHNMWKLADETYGKNASTPHINFANGSAITSDICVSNCTDDSLAVWKTILVAGLNAGGRGYFALDITNPASPSLLWEFTTTAGIGSTKDADLGYSYGQAVITRKDDGTWVVLVTSGYNNTSPGDGKGYLYMLNAATGAIISKISTGIGDTTTPSGLAKIAGWNNETVGNKVGYVYGGDLLGNVWRFDINATDTAAIGTGNVLRFAQLYSDAAGTKPQPVTTTPILGSIQGKRVVFIGTGKYLETSDLTNTQVQTQYAIKDDDATTTLVNPRNYLVHQTIGPNPNGTATRVGTSTNSVNWTSDRGWYVDLGSAVSTADTGERIHVDAILVQGVLLVPTTVPANTSCEPAGHGWLNYFNYDTGTAAGQNNVSASRFGAPIVGVTVIYVGGNPIVQVVTADDPNPTTPEEEIIFRGAAPQFVGTRVTWRELVP